MAITKCVTLDDRKSTMMAGLSYAHFTQYGYLRTTPAGDTRITATASSGDMARLYRYTNGGLTVTPGIGVQWNSENQNEYYYGVSRKESARSGLRGYNPNDSWSPYTELSASYNFLGDWSVYGTARYTRLSDEVTDSPMVDKSTDWPDFYRDHLQILIMHLSRGILCIKTGRHALFCITVVQYTGGNNATKK